MKILKIIFLSGLMALALFLSISPGVAKADSVLDFGMIAPAAGGVSFVSGTNPLVGTGIQIANVVGLITPVNQGVTRNIFGGDLEFTTGNLSGSDASHWYFYNSGGTITLHGGVDLNNNGVIDAGDIPLGTLLFSGTFVKAEVSSADSTKVFISLFSDTKNRDLLNFYGLAGKAGDVWSGTSNLSFLASGSPPNGFTSTSMLSGDIPDKAPEPTTLILLGSGLLGAALYRRLRRPKG